jgi:hypothetical protein
MAYQTTYDVTGNREDLTDDIVNITPRETYLLSNMKRTKATGRYHEWQTDALATASVPNAVEGSDSTSTTRTARTRLGNYCSTNRGLISVSDTQVEVRTAGTDNEFEYEVEIKMKEHARDWEKGFIQSTSASGLAGTARTMSGAAEVITTNISSSGAERQYTYALHYSIAETIANAGGKPDVLYYKSAVQADLATHPASAGGGASTAAPVVISAPTGGITDYYDWYHDSFGRKKLVRNDGNFAISTATASASVFHFEMGRLAFAVLRGTHTKPLAYLGGGPRAKIETEGAFVWGIETAHGKVSNIAN